jgi:hypothetical protein
MVASSSMTMRATALASASALLLVVPAIAQIPQGTASELRAEIAHTRSLRVIVTVATDGQLGEPSAAAQLSQKQLLATLQGTEHEVVLVFPSTPLVALIVGPEALDVLLSHPSVTSVMVDRPRIPSTAAP